MSGGRGGGRQGSPSAHGVHVRAARRAREQVPSDALPVRLRAARAGAGAATHRDAGQDLVSEPTHQVEEAEPRPGRQQRAVVRGLWTGVDRGRRTANSAVL